MLPPRLRRTGIIGAAVVLAICAVVLPVAAMLYLSRTRAIQAEHQRLAAAARSVIARTRMTIDDTTHALRSMEPLLAAPCSPEHIARMQAVTLDAHSVEEIGYFEGDRLKCTTWGITRQTIHQVPVDLITPDGVPLSFSMASALGQGRLMMTTRLGSHHALVDPARLVDIVADPTLQLAVATPDGLLVATHNEPNLDAVRSVLATGRETPDDNYFMASVRDMGLVAVALEPRTQVPDAIFQERVMLLPIGGVIGGLLAGGVFWLSIRRLSLAGELASAVKRRAFVVHYQPLIELHTGRCVGAEALVRWPRGDGSFVQPDLFIPLAEEKGLVTQITAQVVEAALRDLGPALAADRSLHIAINLSAQDLTAGRILALLDSLSQQAAIAPWQIWLEVTERGFVDAGEARETLRRARDKGHVIAIDDFGTGYSSLSYLQDLPIDMLKIDKRFVDTVGHETASSSVAPHIIEMAKSLGLKIVAEGVETSAQADYLRAHGVPYAQGWLFAKAMPAKEFLAFAASVPGTAPLGTARAQRICAEVPRSA